MDHNIDLAVLRSVRDSSARMVDYYSRSDEKRAQNAALEAAGLKPLHNEDQIQWDLRHAERCKREVEVLDAVLAHFGDMPQAEAA